ncbi:MAG: hypothetical protein K2P38_17235, partial [Lachnospiraceae bacterium]|nr:hypothetical protein [Lachnospiraceae bacterium]
MEIYQRQDEGRDEEGQTDTVLIPIRGQAEKKQYVNKNGGIVGISPMSMDIDRNVGLGLNKEQA